MRKNGPKRYLKKHEPTQKATKMTPLEMTSYPPTKIIFRLRP